MKGRLSKLWKNLMNEKWLLLLCFFLGFLSWQGIRRNIGFEMQISNVAVEVDAPEDWAVWEKSINELNILFRGSREDIRNLNSDQLQVVIPVTEPETGKDERIVLTRKHLKKNPTGATVVRFNPPEIFIKLDKKHEVSLPVKANTIGMLPEGLEVEKMVCSPASVNVSGARQVLSEMSNVQTEPIDLKDRQSSFKISVPIALPQTGRMKVDPEWVSVDFILAQRNSSEEFTDIPVRVLCAAGKPMNMTLTPKTVNITVRGQQQRIEQFRTADLFAYVDCSDLSESTGYDLPVNIDLPEGLQLIATDPAVVHVDIASQN